MKHQTENRLPQAAENYSKVADTAMKTVLSLLPLHAEEGGRREVVAESELVRKTVVRGASEDTTKALIYTLRRQFEALALLDPLELQKGNWSFVSFPASLLGRSWLTTLATPDQALLPSDYWEQGEHRPDEIKEEQRALLHRIETERVRFNSEAPPIRTVHVAWAFIRWGNKFLLHRREDKVRPGEKSYGMVGGRFSLSDLPTAIQARDDILLEAFQLDSAVIAQHIAATLQRELDEETGMSIAKHYRFEPFGLALPPYKEVNGAGNRHAYSAYQFHLFQIKLTLLGETSLLSKVAASDRLTWFEISDIAAQQRADGSAAYVDALRQAWGKDLEKMLSAVPDSRAQESAFRGETMMLDLPHTPNATFQLGKPGKEKAVRPTQALEEAQWQLLMLLGWHTRGFQIQIKQEAGIRLLGNGWIEASRLIPLARGLLERTHSGLPNLIEIREDRFVILSAVPEILFFPAEQFRYHVQGSNTAGGEFQLVRLGLETPWATLTGDNYERDINGSTCHIAGTRKR